MNSKITKFYNNYSLDFVEHTNEIYHYTSFNAFKSIIENNKLRFTNRLFLNDYSEGKYILEFCVKNADEIFDNDIRFKKVFVEKCKEQLQNIENDAFQIYQCSFTTDNDCLSMWNYYSGNNGINLEFDSQTIDDYYFEKVGQKSMVFNYGLVVYDKDKQLNIVKKVVADFLVNNANEKDYIVAAFLVKKLIYVGIFFKSDKYSNEKEYRMAFELFSDDGNFEALQTYTTTDYKIDIMLSHGTIVPFVDIRFNKSSLKGITVPALVSKKEQHAIKLFLNANHYNIDEIKTSKITKRF